MKKFALIDPEVLRELLTKSKDRKKKKKKAIKRKTQERTQQLISAPPSVRLQRIAALEKKLGGVLSPAAKGHATSPIPHPRPSELIKSYNAALGELRLLKNKNDGDATDVKVMDADRQRREDEEAKAWRDYNPLFNDDDVASSEEEEEEEEEDKKVWTFRKLPKSARARARKLTEYLKSNNVEWNSRGNLIYDGRVVKGSDVGILISDVVKERRASPRKVGSPGPPRASGYHQFAKILRELNPPTDLIQNQRRWDDIYQWEEPNIKKKKRGMTSTWHNLSGKRRS